MEISDDGSQAQAPTRNLSPQELEFLCGLVAREAQAALASRLNLSEAEANAMMQSLVGKQDAAIAADALRVDISPGSSQTHIQESGPCVAELALACGALQPPRTGQCWAALGSCARSDLKRR